MAQIGVLGEIIFEVSDSVIKTIKDMKWSGSAKYATHMRVGTNALTEFVALEPDKLSFSILLSKNLGVEPHEELNKLWKYERSGEAVPLTIGEKGYGKYRWNVISHEAKNFRYDGSGNVIEMTVSVSLQEYLKS